jgi:uncharacterized protein YbjT (DUF2867 family)
VVGASSKSGLPTTVANLTYVTVDLSRGEDLEAALAGVETVVHSATDPRRPQAVDLEGLRQIERAAAPGVHLIYPGIVGCDLIPAPYYRVKTQCEDYLLESGRACTILRATQFHQLIWSWYSRPSRNPFLLVPAATRYQVLDPLEMARQLAAAVEAGPQGRAPDLGGPTAYEAKDLARSVLAALDSRRRVLSYNRPGLVGASLRAGANLTSQRGGGETWNQFLARQMARRHAHPAGGATGGEA